MNAASSTFLATDGDGYELNMGRWSRQLARHFLDFTGTGVGDGERILDVGCGTGHLAAAAAERSASAQVLGVDISPVYVEYARRQYPEARISFRVGDACALDCADASFDRVLSMLALHFVPRTEAAIGEMVRVAKPGGVVAATVWDVRGGYVANRLFFDTAAALDPAAGIRRARNYTRPLTRPGELGAAWRAAGLADVQETVLAIRMAFASFADYWQPYLGNDGPGAEYVHGLDEARRSRLQEAVQAAYLDGEPDGPRSYAALAWAVRGVVPAAA
ncbi:methyltransferase domain-containing protein [Ramlibacter tataouinensis]|uniref:class I SAM-dependent methyltransferase n=1 Tax=Ramlibacter tataouinensis TaxID=94132 RepID=UPI0022F38CFB|nr:class I SAM-dependent methyltransferase [Ramlibacter tataouinensis]WBY03235.1 methyltransferase domain-containing protein [Ramlibacter tataouinensis]